jgi:hypothetical protein
VDCLVVDGWMVGCCRGLGELLAAAVVKVARHVFLEAQPTELMATLGARHVIATAVLLDRRIAARTLLGIVTEPLFVQCLAIAVEPLELLPLFACAIGVPFVLAVEAECELALGTRAHHQWASRVADHGVGTAALGTPTTHTHIYTHTHIHNVLYLG